jgi:hypothetical protein
MTALALPVALVLLFALFLTAHCALALGLIAASPPNWKGLLVLLPPLAWLAPYWGYRAGMHRRTWLWGLSLASYALVRIGAGWVA